VPEVSRFDPAVIAWLGNQPPPAQFERGTVMDWYWWALLVYLVMSVPYTTVFAMHVYKDGKRYEDNSDELSPAE